MNNFLILPFSEKETPWVIETANAEHWNLCPYELESLLSEDPEGFLIGHRDGQPIGCIQACRYEDSFGFIGFHLVDKAMRGQGYGTQLWQAAMTHLSGRTIGVEGIFSKQSFYREYGFHFHYSNIRHEYINNSTPEITDARLADASVLPFNQLLDYDVRHFGFQRSAFLRRWINYPGGTALVLRHGNTLTGFGCIKPCGQGYKVGPLYAENPVGAEKIFFSLCARAPKGSSVFIDVPEKNLAAAAICENFSMLPISATARMYCNGAPALPISEIYSLGTLKQG